MCLPRDLIAVHLSLSLQLPLQSRNPATTEVLLYGYDVTSPQLLTLICEPTNLTTL